MATALFLSAGLAVAAASAFAAKPAATGKPVVLEGELDVLVEDYADGRTRTRHFLKTEHGRVELQVRGKAGHLPSGSKVRVRGEVQGDLLALDATDAGSMQAITTATSSTMGQQNVAVILVNFQNDLGQPVTPDAARSMMFTTVDNFYQEASFGQTWLNGQVFGYYTIAMDDTVCDNYKIASLADAKATAAGVNLDNYARKVYVFPRNACGWSGLANVGGSSTRAWINGGMSLLVVGHELGHNQGLSHAQSLNCDTSPLGSTCTTHSYGDTADIMGNYRAAHFSPFAKDVLGWLNDGISPPIHTATATGRYSIEPYSSQSVGPKAVRIPRGTDSSGRKLWYYLEYRQPIGADAVLGSTGNLTKGVVVRLATEGDIYSSRQIDMSPNSSTSSYGDLADGALALGQTYTDSTAKVSFTLATADANGATIDVSISGTTTPTCTRAKPVVTLSGPTTAVAAGTQVTYTVAVANKDSSACPATTFNLARSVPSGWTGTLAATTLALSPGASGSTTLKVTSPTTAAAGGFAIGAGTASSVGSTHTANASATYTVAANDSGTTGGTLTETVGTDKATYLRGQTVYMSALVKRDGVAVKGASVSFRVTLPTGSVAVLSATSATDGYARASYRLGKGKSAMGAYALRADATSSGSSATASTGFKVQ